MKKLILLLLSGIVLFQWSCNTASSNDNNHLELGSSNLAIDSFALQTSANSIQDVKGTLIMEPEAYAFVDCFTLEDWWIDDQSGQDLEKQYGEFRTKPYQQVYAELRGYLTDPPQDGFASEYYRVFVVEEVLKIDDLDTTNDCTKVEQVN